MVEPELSFPLALRDLPELCLEQGLGALANANAIQMDDATRLLLLGPEDENHLPSIFGLHDCEVSKLEDKSNSVFADDESEAEQMHLYHDEMADYIVVPSLLDLLPVQYGWGEAKENVAREENLVGKTPNLNPECNMVGEDIVAEENVARKAHLVRQGKAIFLVCSILLHIVARHLKTEKKIKRWISGEAHKLVEGVSIFGVGNWTEVKRVYFKTSFRKPVHLKDKWRDFVRACGINVGSKKKVQAQGATRKIIEGLEEEIISIYRKHASYSE